MDIFAVRFSLFVGLVAFQCLFYISNSIDKHKYKHKKGTRTLKSENLTAKYDLPIYIWSQKGDYLMTIWSAA